MINSESVQMLRLSLVLKLGDFSSGERDARHNTAHLYYILRYTINNKTSTKRGRLGLTEKDGNSGVVVMLKLV